MKINNYTHKELCSVLSDWMARYSRLTPEASLKSGNSIQFIEALAELILDRRTSLQYCEQSTLDEALSRGLAGEFNDSIRFLTAAMITTWIRTVDAEKRKESCRKKINDYNQQKETELQERENKSYQGVFAGMPAHVSFVMHARLGTLDQFYEVHSINDILPAKWQWCIDQLYNVIHESQVKELTDRHETVEKNHGEFIHHLIEAKNTIWKLKETV